MTNVIHYPQSSRFSIGENNIDPILCNRNDAFPGSAAYKR